VGWQLEDWCLGPGLTQSVAVHEIFARVAHAAHAVRLSARAAQPRWTASVGPSTSASRLSHRGRLRTETL
jgi:hypothetical protein